ncbi:hypothetical protein Tco_0282992 [Tanacetum coccineum]
MAGLDFCSKHNMVAYLEKNDGNTEFHQIMDFLTHNSIYFALTASIRSDLLFDDADMIDTLNNQAIFDIIQLMGFLQIFLTNQLKDVPVLVDHFLVPALTKKVLSFMVKKGKNLSGNVTPLFNSMLVQPTEDEGEVSERPYKSQPIPSPTHPSADQPESQPGPSPRPSSPNPIPDSNLEGSSGNHRGQSSSDRSLSGNENGLTLQSGCYVEETAKEEGYGETKEEKECIQTGEETVKSSKGAPYVQTNTDCDALDTDLDEIINESMDYTLAQDEGKTDSMVEEPKSSSKTEEFHLSGDTLVVEDKGSFEKGGSTKGTDLQQSTVKPDEGTDKQNGGTNRIKVSTDSFVEGTAEIKDQVSGESDSSTVPTMTSTPTPTVFGDDETTAQVLVTMSQNKRPRPTSTRSLLTLKPLPKIDPKANGKEMIEEEDEFDTESEDITEAEKKFNMLSNDEEMARKVQEEWEAEEEKKRLAEEEATKATFTNKYDFIQARLNADILN